jgi:hypothetical protein
VIGGPVVDFLGNFVGLSFYDLRGVRTPFLLRNVILGVLAYFNEFCYGVSEVSER